MTQAQYQMDDQTAEVAAIVKTICTEYNIPQSELCRLTYLSAFNRDRHRFKTIRILPVAIPLPKPLQFKVGTKTETDLHIHTSPNPSFEDPRELGLREIELEYQDHKLRFWRWTTHREYSPMGQMVHFIRRTDLKKLYRILHLLGRQKNSMLVKPVLPERMLDEIYDNTIGFLKSWKERSSLYIKHRIPYKRGVLLTGPPGCGKTLTCKWIKELCPANNLSYKIVTLEQFRHAQSNGSVPQLFRLPERGIIFFDDMDVMVKNRRNHGHDLYTFLTEMDGIETTEGVVYIFTTNELEDLDPAFVRPGRIDLFLIFEPPNDKLRKRFIEKMFDPELLPYIDTESIVKKTEEFSFAEIEEIRKLLARDLIEGREISVEKTFKTFDMHRKSFLTKQAFGFGQQLDGNEDDEYYEDEDEDEVPMIGAPGPPF